MTERNGLTVEMRSRPQGKQWVFVTTKAEGSPVAFEDWFYMVRDIVACEVIKYGGDPNNEADWNRWGTMAREFLVRAFDYSATWPELRDEFGLPGSPTVTFVARLLDGDR